MGTLWQDIRYGFRTLRKSPGFTAVAVAALALGIGANSAIFSVVNAVVLRPLPFPEPERLVAVGGRDLRSGSDFWEHSYPNFSDLRDQRGVFEHAAAYGNTSFFLTDGDERVSGAPRQRPGPVADVLPERSHDSPGVSGGRPAGGAPAGIRCCRIKLPGRTHRVLKPLSGR